MNESEAQTGNIILIKTPWKPQTTWNMNFMVKMINRMRDVPKTVQVFGVGLGPSQSVLLH